jgi:hypothetical protein
MQIIQNHFTNSLWGSSFSIPSHSSLTLVHIYMFFIIFAKKRDNILNDIENAKKDKLYSIIHCDSIKAPLRPSLFTLARPFQLGSLIFVFH